MPSLGFMVVIHVVRGSKELAVGDMGSLVFDSEAPG
jgi:hypothetical protein